MSYVVEVEDRLNVQLTGRSDSYYTSPALAAHEARGLVAILLGCDPDRALEPGAGRQRSPEGGGR